MSDEKVTIVLGYGWLVAALLFVLAAVEMALLLYALRHWRRTLDLQQCPTCRGDAVLPSGQKSC